MPSNERSSAASSAAFDPATVRILVTIEARMTSTRLPGKILEEVAPGVPILRMMVERLRRSQTIAGICIATTTNASDDPVEELAAMLGIGCHRGSEEDVLLRVLEAARTSDADVIVETTGDCPLIDPALLDACVLAYFADDVHYCSNIATTGLPRGLEAQVFSVDVLAEVDRVTDDLADHEHVSLYIYEHPEQYSLRYVPALGALRRPDVRLTVDTPDDLALVRSIVAALGTTCTAAEAIAWLDLHPDVAALNRGVEHKAVR